MLYKFAFLGVTLLLLPSVALAAPKSPAPSCASYFGEVHHRAKDVIERRLGTETQLGDDLSREVGVLRRAAHPRLQEAIDRLREYGGEVRILESRNARTGEPARGSSYFHYDTERHIPYIALTLTASLKTLEHELIHFEDWARAYQKYKPHTTDAEDLEAVLETVRSTPSFTQRTETNAIRKELQVMAQASSAQGKGRLRSPTHPSSALPDLDLDTFVRAVTYPDTQALLHQFPWEPRAMTEEELSHARRFLDSALRKAFLLRKTARQRALDRARELGPRKLESRELFKFARAQTDLGTLFDQIFSAQLARFEQLKQADNLRKLYDERLRFLLEGVKAKEPATPYFNR